MIAKALQRYWRLSRGLTLGAQGVIVDESNRVLLIRHTYVPGWRFPGGGVERREPVELALARELGEEAGVVLTGPAELFGIYANFRIFPNDHVALFVTRQWHQTHIPPPNREIVEQARFSPDALPPDVNPATARRIAEIFAGAPRDTMW
jgi:ADP-ribose pyrophosphatase YjhB (NUDIX family)